MKKKVLFLSPYPKGIGASQRFRFEQYLPSLSEEYNCVQKTFWNKKAWDSLFKEGHHFQKLYFLSIAFLKRALLLFTIPQYDLVFIHREAAHIGPPIIEWFIIKLFKKKVIYDFDDAIWRLNYSQKNPIVKYFKSPQKVQNICKWASAITCGNAYLSEFAQQYNNNVWTIPTTIDTNYHVNANNKNNKLCIGWTGTLTTLKHINLILPILQELEQKYDFTFLVISNDKPNIDLSSFEFLEWKKETEISDLSQIDIGIMPLPDEEWEKGKCGFKGLQFMALETPTIMSPVGVNKEIIKDGENGFLAQTKEEWVEKLSLLINSESLRVKLGKAGRETVIEKYSVDANKQKYKEAFSSVLNP